MVSKFSDVALANCEEDKLGFKDYAEGIISKIESVSEKDTPFTIAVFGPWGSGKTSLMRCMQGLLNSRGYKTIFFNSWEYGNEDKPWIPFMIQVVKELFEEEMDRKELMRNVFLFSTDIVLQHYSQGKLSTGSILDLVKRSRKTSPFREWSDEDVKNVIERVTKIEEFKKKIRQRAENSLPKKKIIIFIDDLDRIPEKLIDFLNSLKTFLDIRGCIFIMGCDYKILDNELKKKYTGEIYEDYFDKIVQTEFYIPRISEQAIKGYLRFLTGWGEKEIEECTQLVVHSIGGNPRKIKRAVNATVLIKSVFESKLVTILQEFERPKQRIKPELAGKEEIEEPADLRGAITRIFTPAKVFEILFDTEVLFKLVCMRERWYELYESILSEEAMRQALVSVQNAYMFSWNDIPEKDGLTLIKFLRQKYNIDWLEIAEVNKIDDSRAINISSGKNSLSFKLNNEKTKVDMEIDGDKKDEFIAKTEEGKLKIYAYDASTDNKKLLDACEEKGERFKDTEKNLHIFLEDLPRFQDVEDIKTYLTLLGISSPEAGIYLEYAEPETLPDNLFNRYMVFERINRGKVEEEIIEKKINQMDWESDLSSYYFFTEVIRAFGYGLIKRFFENENNLKRIADIRKIKESKDPGAIGWLLYSLSWIDKGIAGGLLKETKDTYAEKIRESKDLGAIGSLLSSVSGISEETVGGLLKETKDTIAEKIRESKDLGAIEWLLSSVSEIDKEIAGGLLKETKDTYAEKIRESKDPRAIGPLLSSVSRISEEIAGGLLKETKDTYAEKIRESKDLGAIESLLDAVRTIDEKTAKKLENDLLAQGM